MASGYFFIFSAILFTKNGRIKASAQKEFPQLFPSPGHVEHDVEAIWKSQLGTARSAIRKAGISSKKIASIGITNQRETTIVWDRNTGDAVYNAIVWQDRRTAEYCDQLREDGWADKIREKTGLVLDSYFSGTKVKWILDNVEGAREAADRGEPSNVARA